MRLGVRKGPSSDIECRSDRLGQQMLSAQVRERDRGPTTAFLHAAHLSEFFHYAYPEEERGPDSDSYQLPIDWDGGTWAR